MCSLDLAARPTYLPPRSAPERVVWLSLASAWLGWLFDAMDLQIFTVILFPSISELIGSSDPGKVAYVGGLVLAAKLVAWGLGGIVFGVTADRIGRTRTMIVTILIYSTFTALSALAGTWWQLAILQAIAGVGVGGEWAAGAALVAETWSEATRARAMQIVQMAFGFGFFLAALVNLLVGPFGWRYVLAVGVLPALVALFIRRFVPESERWLRVRERRRVASATAARDFAIATFFQIFAPGMRRRTIVGLLAASAMMIGSWGTGTLLSTWVRELLGVDQSRLAIKVTSEVFMLSTAGGLVGYLTLVWLSDAVGRRWSYFLMVLGSAAVNVFLFAEIASIDRLLWFMPLYGFFTIGGFGTFAAYLPELFPTRIRATGQGFCWNMARSLTAVGPFASGLIASAFGSAPGAGLAVSTVYVVGAIAIWFGPETKGKPIED